MFFCTTVRDNLSAKLETTARDSTSSTHFLRKLRGTNWPAEKPSQVVSAATSQYEHLALRYPMLTDLSRAGELCGEVFFVPASGGRVRNSLVGTKTTKKTWRQRLGCQAKKIRCEKKATDTCVPQGECGRTETSILLREMWSIGTLQGRRMPSKVIPGSPLTQISAYSYVAT